MTEHADISPRPSLFARKGEAEPAPAVAFVSLRHMYGKPEQRAERPDRREHMEAYQPDGESADKRIRHGPDHDGRRHFTPRSGLAFGQRYVPWAAPENEADASVDTAKGRKAKKTVGSLSVASLSALIHRHRDGPARPVLTPQSAAATTSPAPEPGPAVPRRPEAPAAKGPTKVDMAHLSTSGTRGRRPAVAKSPADPVAQPPATRKRKMKRKKVTVRLELDQFRRIKALADRAGQSRQSIMAQAVADYLNKIV